MIQRTAWAKVHVLYAELVEAGLTLWPFLSVIPAVWKLTAFNTFNGFWQLKTVWFNHIWQLDSVVNKHHAYKTTHKSASNKQRLKQVGLILHGCISWSSCYHLWTTKNCWKPLRTNTLRTYKIAENTTKYIVSCKDHCGTPYMWPNKHLLALLFRHQRLNIQCIYVQKNTTKSIKDD